MVSRKRNKGKERKAKKEKEGKERINHLWKGWARGCKDDTNPMGLNRSIRCDHGCDLAILDNPSYPVCGFLDLLFISEKWSEPLIAYEKVWDNSCLRNSAIHILTRIGTNLLLGQNMNADANRTPSKLKKAEERKRRHLHCIGGLIY